MNAMMLTLLIGVACATFSTAAPAEPLKLDKPLIAYWTFDETMGSVCRDASGNGCDTTEERGAAGFERVAGVFDGGLNFTGRHLLRCGEKPVFGTLAKISFSAWVQPAGFDHYNEIFRKEDGEKRALFSFQENGRVLSLGLNINGYFECDAKIEPAQVADGLWHHAAAVFDGEVMRVYLDGAQVGAMARPGLIAAGGPAHGCIGSSNGGECFRGQMDELRIYADALTGDEIRRLYRNGVEALARSSGPAHAAVEAIYAPGTSFAETLAGTRRNAVEKGVRLDAKVTAVLLQRLKTNYPEECKQFQLWTLANPGSYLRSKGNEFHLEVAGRLVEMLTEYKPLTDAQRKKQTAEDQRRWDEAAAIEKKFAALKARADAAQFSPEWIELMFEAGRGIVWRPQEQEAVAPYITPQTPETRSLTAAEAHEALERDWLFQADGKPTPERIKNEIKWTRELAARLGVDATKALAELEKAETSTATYFKVRELKRRIM
ncbi:MAG: LamG domain-containing protein, partial [Verrucomicrobia bacterium]|nr:LamG domain-containing protein [Verrucomicrobiota bacterium]